MVTLAYQRRTRTALPNDTAISPMEAIEIAAATELRQSSYFGVRRVSCNFHEGVLTLQGAVPSYFLKQIAQTLVYGLPGVRDVDNRIDVTPRPGLPATEDSWKRRPSYATHRPR